MKDSETILREPYNIDKTKGTTMQISPETNISKHFTVADVTRSDTAVRMHIDNALTEEAFENAVFVAENVLEPIREHYNTPFHPNSWYRSEALERALCRNAFWLWCRKRGLNPVDPESWRGYFLRKSHPRGEAVDIEIPGVPNDDLLEWIRANIPVYDQLIREYARPGFPFSGWVHVSLSRTKNRMEILTIP